MITIAGKKHWLWRAVDQDGIVLDVNDNFLSSSLGQSAGDNIAGGPDGSYTLLLSIKKDAVATTVKQLGLYRVVVKAQ